MICVVRPNNLWLAFDVQYVVLQMEKRIQHAFAIPSVLCGYYLYYIYSMCVYYLCVTFRVYASRRK